MQDENATHGDLFKSRDRLVRQKSLAMTPAERLEAMQRLLEQSRYILEQNPAGIFHFLKRNYRARSIGNDRSMGAS